MPDPPLSRRTVLEGVGTACGLSLAGCTSPLKTDSGAEDDTQYFLPGGDHYWGPNGPVQWVSPATMYTHRDSFKRINQYDRLVGKYSAEKYGLDFEDVTLLFYDYPRHLFVYEGDFTADDVKESLQEWNEIADEDDYRGFQILNGFYSWFGIQNGRLITLRKTQRIPDPREAIHAVIDTITGHHPPHLTEQPDFHGIMSELEPGLSWYYDPVVDDPPLSGVMAHASSTHIAEGTELVTRFVYSFSSSPNVDSDELDHEIASIYYRHDPPTISQHDNHLIIEARDTIEELANA